LLRSSPGNKRMSLEKPEKLRENIHSIQIIGVSWIKG
jgi:hypothetical protein